MALFAGSATSTDARDFDRHGSMVSRAVRCSDAPLCALLEAGRAELPMLETLLSQIVRLNGVVHIAWTPTLAPPLEAALLHRIQITPDGTTCLWIAVHRKNHTSRALIPVIAHELQHAIEVLESGALTSAEIEAYFRRRAASGGRVHETDAARRVQQRVERELQSR